SIRDTYDVEMFVKEEVQNRSEINRAVDELVKNGVNLIFGHSNVYGRPFVEIAPEYPHVHFVYFNGGHWEDNVTTFNFNTHAMGFFRSEEHTSELQSRFDLVCRLLLEKKK